MKMDVKWTKKLKQRIIRDTKRMMTMLWAISSVPVIKKMMEAVGYTDEVHQKAWAPSGLAQPYRMSMTMAHSRMSQCDTASCPVSSDQ